MTVSKAADWQPGCSLTMLRQRAVLRQCIRDFFTARDYLEVDTPLLSADTVIDAHLNPVAVELGHHRMYLQTSPEAAMKRLLAAGSGSIFQLTPAFRGDESGRLHNPEFMMLEWYETDTTWQDQVQLTEELVRAAVQTIPHQLQSLLPTEAFTVTTYQEAFQQHLNLDVLTVSIAELRQCVADRLPETPPPDQRDDLLNLLLASVIEPMLGVNRPEFLVDYPSSQAALAEVSAVDERVACRFELYIHGMEICNGYQELRDPDELRRREAEQQQQRRRMGVEELPGARRLLAAMDAGLPACSGVALGFDRLLLLLTGAADIQKCLPFSVERA